MCVCTAKKMGGKGKNMHATYDSFDKHFPHFGWDTNVSNSARTMFVKWQCGNKCGD